MGGLIGHYSCGIGLDEIMGAHMYGMPTEWPSEAMKEHHRVLT